MFTIFNFMFLENLQFAEGFAMTLSILLYVLAAKNITENKYIKSVLLTIFAILCYQGTIGAIMVYTYLFSIIKNEKISDIIKKLLVAIGCCLIAVCINLIQIKICGKILGMTNIRMGTIQNIPYMILYILNTAYYTIFYTANMFPTGIFFIYNIILLFISNLIKNKCFYKIFILIVITFISAYALNFFTMAGINTPRLLFVIGALIGNIFIIIYVETDVFEKFNFKYVLEYILIISYAFITIYMYRIQIVDHKKIAYNTYLECKTIEEYIIEYEQESNMKITNIAICYDENPTYYYKEFKRKTALYIRPLSVEWADEGSLNYYTNRKLKEIVMPQDIFKSYFYKKNWDSLSKEQFVFIGDTMYYCIY